MVALHDELAGDGVLEVADGVLRLHLDQFLLDMLVLAAVALDLLLVGRGDVSLAEDHQVVDVVARIEEKAAYRRVGHLVGDQRDGAQMQQHQLLHVLHVVGLRHLQAREDILYHLGTHVFVAMKGPARSWFPLFRRGLADVVEEGRPAEPEVVAHFSHVVEHLERMPEIVLVAAPFHRLHAFEVGQRGKDVRQQLARIEQVEAHGGLRGLHNLVEFVGDALGGEDL